MKTLKFSWGYKILFVYLAFVAGILFLAYKANSEKYDLVTEHYYEQELKYQEVIDQKSNVAALSAPITISHSVNQVRIAFPPELSGLELKGEAYLYRASDASKDIRKAFSTSDGNYTMELPAALSGMYELKLSWVANGRSYFEEKRIFF